MVNVAMCDSEQRTSDKMEENNENREARKGKESETKSVTSSAADEKGNLNF